jgi:hypothetical protein
MDAQQTEATHAKLSLEVVKVIADGAKWTVTVEAAVSIGLGVVTRNSNHVIQNMATTCIGFGVACYTVSIIATAYLFCALIPSAKVSMQHGLLVYGVEDARRIRRCASLLFGPFASGTLMIAFSVLMTLWNQAMFR